VRQNDGRLSANKRKSYFEWMTDEEVARFEAIVERAFSFDIDLEDIARLPEIASRPS
jgi:hypothetical protein